MPHGEIINKRLKFLEVDADTSRYLDKFQQLLIPSIDDMLDRMYDQILAVPELKDLFPDKETIQAERKAQKKHWLDILFSKDFGTLHFDNAERIGTAHERIGLTLGWYVNIYCLMINKFVRLAADHYEGDAVALTQMVQAINKAVFLDMNFVIDSYLNAKDASMKQLLIEAEQFTAERLKMDKTLAKEANDLQSSLEDVRTRIESLAKQSESINQALQQLSIPLNGSNSKLQTELTNTGKTGLALEKGIRNTHSVMQRAVNDSAALVQRIRTLKEELEQLQNQHKLHYFPSENDRLYDKIKLFLTSKLR